MQSIHKTKKNIQILKEATNLIIIEPPTLGTQDDLQEFAELDKEYDRISKLRSNLIHRLAAKSHTPSEAELIEVFNIHYGLTKLKDMAKQGND